MDSLIGYGSDDDNETDRYPVQSSGSSGVPGGSRRREDDTNYDDVNMDMSEDSEEESEPELPPAEPSAKPQQQDRRSSEESRDRDRDRGDRRDKRRDRDRPERRDRRDDRYRPERNDRGDITRPERNDRGDVTRPERNDRGRGESSRRPDRDRPDRPVDRHDGKAPPEPSKSHDTRDTVSPRFLERGERRERDRPRERYGRRDDARGRSRSRSGRRSPPPQPSGSGPGPGALGASSEYRPSSYKVNRKLDVMEKMGLQIKTPDGSMATAQQLRAAADQRPVPGGGPLSGLTSSARLLDQKRKLLWSHKKSEAEEAAKWSGTRFAQDQDGKQASKFMRLMGIKEPGAVKAEPTDKTADPIKKQEELFQAMQAQYEVARATTHTMRGVGLGFQRGQF